MNKTKLPKALVTGGAGYIGSVLVGQLLAQGYFVRVIDNLMHNNASPKTRIDSPNLDFIKADIRAVKNLENAFNDIDYVFHLAAIVGDPACQKDQKLSREVNLDASIELFEIANKKNIKRFIFSSTCSNYGKMADESEYVDENSPLKPVSLYAKLKVDFENYILNYGKNSNLVPVSLRFATAYGLSPRMRFDLTVNEFTREILLKRKLLVYGEQFWRPYCHVEDIAHACIKVLEADESIVSHNTFNVGDTQENYQKKTIADLIAKNIPDVEIKYVHKDEDPRNYKVNFSKIKEVLGFKITKRLPDGIAEIVKALNGNIFLNPYDLVYQNC
jgi:nucleoside-diphosphate-sugar epimerase